MKEMTAEEVAKLLKSGENLSVIDVRENEEVAQGKIPGAKHIPLGEIPDRKDEMNKQKSHVIVCRSGSRSGNATQYLEKQGYDVTNMTGGMLDWKGEIEK